MDIAKAPEKNSGIKRKLLNVLKYSLFFLAGVGMFYWVYKGMKLSDLKNELHRINYWWLILSFVLGMFSHLSRAIRWNMLIRPLGYKPRTINSFLAVMVMYFVNLLVPRAGEIVRCTVLTRYEKVPFTALIGTVVIERVTDVIMLAAAAFFILLSQVGVFNEFFANNPGIHDKIGNLLSARNLVILIILIASGLLLLFLFRRSFRHKKIFNKVYNLFRSFTEGIKTIGKLENVWAYIGHTLFIYLMWLVMLYVVFFSYPPTEHLSLITGMVAFVMGGLAMIAPVQGGIGAWHFMVFQTLFIYGIPIEQGKIFALIAWTTTNLSLMLVGLIALLILPVINRKKQEL